MSKTRPRSSPVSDPAGGLARALGGLWRLFFTPDRPPRNLYERDYIRGRAGFFFLLGVAATLAVQEALARLGLWAR